MSKKVHASDIPQERVDETEKNRHEPWVKTYAGGKPNYTTPAEKREWVGLTEEEAIELLPIGDWEVESTLEFAKAIEAKLKEKNR